MTLEDGSGLIPLKVDRGGDRPRPPFAELAAAAAVVGTKRASEDGQGTMKTEMVFGGKCEREKEREKRSLGPLQLYRTFQREGAKVRLAAALEEENGNRLENGEERTSCVHFRASPPIDRPTDRPRSD